MNIFGTWEYALLLFRIVASRVNQFVFQLLLFFFLSKRYFLNNVVSVRDILSEEAVNNLFITVASLLWYLHYRYVKFRT